VKASPPTTYRAGLQWAVYAHLNDCYGALRKSAVGLLEPYCFRD